MKRYFIYLTYNGKNYHGWQMQSNVNTVQKQIQDSLSILLSRPIFVTGAGRTDSGVHAYLMIAHFDWESFLQTHTLALQLNKILPNDIFVHKIIPVKIDAHARFSAISRTYTYAVRYEKDPFQNGQFYLSKYRLNIDIMNKAAIILLGYIDFSSFCKLHSNTKTNFCHIKKAEWNIMKNMIIFTIQSDRFLRNMVRSIVGTLIDVGRGKLSIQVFEKIIKSKNRANASTSAPAHGLFLTDIKYPIQIFNI